MKNVMFALLVVLSINVSIVDKAEARLSWLSRANCASFNESVTWDIVSHYLWTYTSHSKNGVFMHGWNTGWRYTWRSYAGHNEWPGGWYVWGNHYRWLNWNIYKLGTTHTTDCNLSQW